MIVDTAHRFHLQIQGMPDPVWGFGDLSYLTYKRTYAREGEEWFDTCRRVVEGVFTVLRWHARRLRIPWDEAEAQHKATDMFGRIYTFKFLPPGRGLWMMGTEFFYEHGSACVNNCAFASTKDVAHNYADPFVWTFNMLMLGVGVGFDVRGAGTCTIKEPRRTSSVMRVEDSREGWAEVAEMILNAYTCDTPLFNLDYDNVRPEGAPIKGFGGKASGPAPLRLLADRLTTLYDAHIGKPVTSALIVDTFNIIAACVVSGGVRRSAQIAFGQPDDLEFVTLKQDEEKLYAWRYASNNSVFAHVGMDYQDLAEHTKVNGEPGYAWLDNMRAYGRMKDAPTWADDRVLGGNPCLEISLEDRELCNLVETFPAHHKDRKDFLATLKAAYLYSKAVTLVPTHSQKTNAVMMRNRRIGASVSGIAQAVEKMGFGRLMSWLDTGYDYIGALDREYSEWLCVPQSIKRTAVKPSGTVSLVAGSTPGVHFDHAPFYVRRVRFADTSPLLAAIIAAGYPVEQDRYADNTFVVEFPVSSGAKRGKSDVTIWEKTAWAAAMQHTWADNQVSATVDFKPHEGDDIARVLATYDRQLKGISFLPTSDHGYAQAPYETITEDEYKTRLAGITPIGVLSESSHEMDDAYCSGDACAVDL